MLIVKLSLITMMPVTADETQSLAAAARILSGDIPADDYFTSITPGFLYVKATLIYLFGETVLAQRVVSLIVSLLVSLFILYFSEKILGKYLSLIPFVASMVWLTAYSLDSSPMLWMMLVAFVGIYLFFRYFATQNKLYIVVAGAALGLLAMVKFDVAAYLLGAEFWAVFFFRLAHYKKVNMKLKRKVTIALRETVPFVGGILVIFAPFLTYFLIKVDVGELWRMQVFYPYYEMASYYAIEFPNLMMLGDETKAISAWSIVWQSIAFVLPPVAVILTAFSLYYRTKNKTLSALEPRFWYVMMTLNAVGNLFGQCLIDSREEMLLPSLIPALILYLWLLGPLKKPLRNALIVLITAFYLISPIDKITGIISGSNELSSVKTGNLRGTKTDPNNATSLDELYQAVSKMNFDGTKWLMLRSREGVQVVNMSYPHRIYYHLGITSPIYTHEISPFTLGDVDDEVQLIDEIRKQKIDFILLERNARFRRTHELELLDKFIELKYFPIKSVAIDSENEFVILSRI